MSMIPAALAGLRHYHTVVDLCAAPGSKTEQVIRYSNVSFVLFFTAR